MPFVKEYMFYNIIFIHFWFALDVVIIMNYTRRTPSRIRFLDEQRTSPTNNFLRICRALAVFMFLLAMFTGAIVTVAVRIHQAYLVGLRSEKAPPMGSLCNHFPSYTMKQLKCLLTFALFFDENPSMWLVFSN